MGLALIGLGGAACGGAPPTTSVDPVVPEAAPTVKRCTNDDLDAVPGQWEGATGSVVGFVVLANRTQQPCILGGFPDVELDDDRGHVIRATGRFDTPVTLVTLDPRAGPVVLAPGRNPRSADGARPGQGSMMFVFANACPPLRAGPWTVVLTLPGETRAFELPTLMPSPPRCDVPGSPPTLSVGPVERPPP